MKLSANGIAVCVLLAERKDALEFLPQKAIPTPEANKSM